MKTLFTSTIATFSLVKSNSSRCTRWCLGCYQISRKRL